MFSVIAWPISISILGHIFIDGIGNIVWWQWVYSNELVTTAPEYDRNERYCSQSSMCDCLLTTELVKAMTGVYLK